VAPATAAALEELDGLERLDGLDGLDGLDALADLDGFEERAIDDAARPATSPARPVATESDNGPGRIQ
jgi:hypothetical protein